MLSAKVVRECALGEEDPQRPWRTKCGLVFRTAFATLYMTNGRTVEEGPYLENGSLYEVPHNRYMYNLWGLYTMTETIDKTFINTRFQRYPGEEVHGYLYQARDQNAYFDEERYNRKGWQLKLARGKKPEGEEDYEHGDQKMHNLIHTLTSNPTDDLLRKNLDMDSMNAYLAGACLCSHWDSLAVNRNNDYIFYLKREVLDDDMNPIVDENNNPVDEEHKWYVIAWDLDNTLWDDSTSSSVWETPYKGVLSNCIYEPAKVEGMKTNLIETVFNSGRTDITDGYNKRLREMRSGYYGECEYNKKVDEHGNGVKQAIEETTATIAGTNVVITEAYKAENYEEIKQHAATRRFEFWNQLNA